MPEFGQRVRLRVLAERIVDGVSQILRTLLFVLLGQQTGKCYFQNALFLCDGDPLYDAG